MSKGKTMGSKRFAVKHILGRTGISRWVVVDVVSKQRIEVSDGRKGTAVQMAAKLNK